jgi:hypothetical protein|tara:strand:+ start:204 stop:323 length:120 start_codon:yes stop_codon:yes gene_type:complete
VKVGYFDEVIQQEVAGSINVHGSIFVPTGMQKRKKCDNI